MAATRRTLVPGQQLQGGRYRVSRALSQGGMGAIFLATQPIGTSVREVVLKVMLDDFDPLDQAAFQQATALFTVEAETLAKLRHPHIAQIYEFFVENDTPVIVMQYIAGSSLADYLSRTDDQGRQTKGQPFAMGLVVEWGMLLCDVLAYLGAQPVPVMHNDIKPANIIRDGGRLCLVDFGSAKIRRATGAAAHNRTTLYGTPGYAAPEQHQGQSLPSSDIYGLAATLFHLATDQPPPIGGIRAEHLRPLGRFGAVLAAALARDPASRPSASELKQRLQSLVAAPAGHILRAPDGTEFADTGAGIKQLVQWCVDHWDDALGWLGGALPQQIQIHWQQHALGADLQRIAQPGRPTGQQLDTALAQLDPQGFGLAKPQIEVAGRAIQPGPQGLPQLDFGGLAVDGSGDAELLLKNPGPRYVEARLDTPSWVRAEPAQIALAPGASARVTLTADMAQVTFGGALTDVLRLHGQPVLGLAAHVAPWRTAASRLGEALVKLGRLAAGAGRAIVVGLAVVLGALLALLTHETVLLVLGAMLAGGFAGGLAGLLCWWPIGMLNGWLPSMLDAGASGWAADQGARLLRWAGSGLAAGAPARFDALALGLGMAGLYAGVGAITGLLLTLFSESSLKGVLLGALPGAGLGCLLGIPIALLIWLGAAAMVLFGGAFMTVGTALNIILALSLAGLFVGAIAIALD